MNCQIVNESEIGETLAVALKDSLCICFPEEIEIFSKVTYWYSIPSYRVIVEQNSCVIAHIAVVDRTIVAGEKQIRVAGIQSVFVLPEHRKKDLSDKMFSLVLEESRRRNYDASLLFCVPELEGYYQRFDYETLNNVQIAFTNDSGIEQNVPSGDVAMWLTVCKNIVPSGDVGLNGNKW